MGHIGIRRRVLAGGVVIIGAAASLVVAAPASAVTGLVVVTATSTTDLGGFKYAEAFCPSGTRVLGGGGDIVGGGYSVHLFLLRPIDNGVSADSYVVGAGEHDSNYNGSWSVTVWAICASGVTGHVIVEAVDPANLNETYSYAIANCPAGKKVIGAGGAVYKLKFVLNSIYLQPTLTSVIVEGYRVDDYTGSSGMGVHAYAVCVNPVPGQQLVSASSGVSSDDKAPAVQCPSGTKVHGTGAWLAGAHGEAYIDALLPYGPVYGVHLNAREDATGFGGVWDAHVYAICAQ